MNLIPLAVVAQLPEEGLNHSYWPPLKGYTPTPVFVSNAPAGVNNVYTCPTGKRAYWGQLSTFNPNSITAGTVSPFVIINGTSYRVRPDFTAAPLARGAVSGPNITYILEPGDTISLVTSIVGLNLSLMIVEYPLDISVRGARLLDLITGPNLLYIVPEGKMASTFYIQSWFNQTGAIYYVNESGGSRLVTGHLVPPGGTPDGSTQQWPAVTVANNGFTGGIGIDSYMRAGDGIYINVDDGIGQQSAYIPVIEFDQS